MKKPILTLVMLCFMLLSGFSQIKWEIDKVHSSIQFEVSHMTVSSVTGQFLKFDAEVITPTEKSFENAQINATIDASSITTNNLERDKHLKDDDFFNVDKYPQISFVSRSFEKKSGNSYIITGDLTIKGITKTIKLMTEFGGMVSLNDEIKAGFEATTTIDRFEFGLSWDDVLDSGGLIVGEDVEIILKIELVKSGSI